MPNGVTVDWLGQNQETIDSRKKKVKVVRRKTIFFEGNYTRWLTPVWTFIDNIKAYNYKYKDIYRGCGGEREGLKYSLVH